MTHDMYLSLHALRNFLVFVQLPGIRVVGLNPFSSGCCLHRDWNCLSWRKGLAKITLLLLWAICQQLLWFGRQWHVYVVIAVKTLCLCNLFLWFNLPVLACNSTYQSDLVGPYVITLFSKLYNIHIAVWSCKKNRAIKAACICGKLLNAW